MFEFSLSKEMGKKNNIGKKENSNISSSTNCQGIEINVEHCRVITTLNMIKHENTLFSVVVGSPRSLVITKQTSL